MPNTQWGLAELPLRALRGVRICETHGDPRPSARANRWTPLWPRIRCNQSNEMTKKNPAAVALGRIGGKVKSEAKAAAARLNREKGAHKAGRPKGSKDKQPRKKKSRG